MKGLVTGKHTDEGGPRDTMVTELHCHLCTWLPSSAGTPGPDHLALLGSKGVQGVRGQRVESGIRERVCGGEGAVSESQACPPIQEHWQEGSFWEPASGEAAARWPPTSFSKNQEVKLKKKRISSPLTRAVCLPLKMILEKKRQG